MKSGKIFLALSVVLILCLLVLGVSYLYLNSYIHSSPSVQNNTVLIIPKGRGLKSISRKLKEEGVIKSDALFAIYVMSRGWQNTLKAGEYRFNKGETLSDVASKIVNGDVVSYSVTIPEGITVLEIADLLNGKEVFDRDEFLDCLEGKKVDDESDARSVENFEGYLFPDTYSYVSGVTCSEFIDMMLQRFHSIFDSMSEERENMNLTDNEILTLASIIEKETGDTSERALISAVFHNRMRIGMRLESDPTVIYGLGDDYNGNLTKLDLDTYTEYNTYKIKGLPPGPIANPGMDSIAAVLNPADVKYLYFVSKGDGTHEFSTNYNDHRRAVYKYQR